MDNQNQPNQEQTPSSENQVISEAQSHAPSATHNNHYIIWILITIIILLIGIVGYFIANSFKKVDSISKLPAFDRSICSPDSYFMGWGDKTAERLEQYDIQTDECDGYRCIANNNISPACYSKDECASGCNGKCVNATETKKICQQLGLQTSPTPDPKADWKTYKNNQLGFALRYPDDWRLEEKPNSINFLKKVREPEPIGPYESLPQDIFIEISYTKGVLSNTTIDSWLADEIKRRNLEGFTARIDYLTVGGEKALETSFPSRFGENVTIFIHNNYIFKVYVEPITKEDRATVESARDQILSTFKFTDQPTQMCTPRPACLDAETPCLMPEDANMCPKTPTACPAAPICKEGEQLLHGDPGPDSDIKCPIYSCVKTNGTTIN